MTIGAGDLALSLPTETATFSAVGTLPVGRVDTHHLLVMARDITANEVEALAMSQDLHSGWVGASRLQLLPGAELQGPWNLEPTVAWRSAAKVSILSGGAMMLNSPNPTRGWVAAFRRTPSRSTTGIP